MRDTAELLRLIRRAEKRNVYAEAETTVRVAILGSYSIQYIVKALRYILFERYGLNADVFEGDYDGIAKTLLDAGSNYYRFQPEVTVILPDSTMTDTAFFTNIWKKLPGHILQANLVVPNLAPLGNLEINTPSSRNFQIMEANLALARQKPGNVTLLDLDGLAARMGKDRWFDYPAFFSTKQGFSLEFLEEVCSLIARQIGALRGKAKKCLVLDLDNTLWGGTVGDDGWSGINLDPNDPVGEAYRYFQRFVLSLKERGVILAVCSKNEPDTAREPQYGSEALGYCLFHCQLGGQGGEPAAHCGRTEHRHGQPCLFRRQSGGAGNRADEPAGGNRHRRALRPGLLRLDPVRLRRL